MRLSNSTSKADAVFRSLTRSAPGPRAWFALVIVALFSALAVDRAQAGVILAVSSDSADGSFSSTIVAPEQEGDDDGQVERRSQESMPGGAGTSFGGATSAVSFALSPAPDVISATDCSARSLEEGALFLPDSPLFERLQPPRALV